MNKTQLAEIKTRFVAGAMRAEDVPDLIAEVERLREELDMEGIEP